MKKLCIFFSFLLAFLALSLPAHASVAPVVYDDGDFLTEDEESRLTSQACNCTFAGLRPYLITLENASTPSSTWVKNKYGLNENSDAVVLVVRTLDSTYYYDMYTYGKANDVFSDTAVDEILDDPDVYQNLKSGKVFDGYSAFYSACHVFTGDYEQEELAREQARAEREARAPMEALLCALVVGVLAGGISVLCVFLAYRRKRHGESYPLDRYAKLHLTQCEDVFVGSYVTRVRVQSSSGGSRGGGGGHRGGR